MDYLGCCGNICSSLSCYADSQSFVEKVCPCMRKKEQPPKFKEETYKITFLGTTVIKFEKLEENIS